MRSILLLTALAALSACENYTDQTSPCFGKNGKPIVSRSAFTPVLLAVPLVSQNASHDCLFRPVNTGS